MDKRSKFQRIAFCEPGGPAKMHCVTINDWLVIDIPTFVTDMVEGAKKWLGEVAGTMPFEKNFEASMKRYPSGIKPVAFGLAVIA